MNRLLTLIAKVLNSDSPIDTWKFFNWLLYLWSPPFIGAIAFSGRSLVSIVLLLVLGIGMIILSVFYYRLRRSLVSMGIPKSELVAYANGTGSSLAASALIAMLVCVVVYFAFEAIAKHLGVWETIGSWEPNLIIQCVILMTVMSLFGLIGWLLWGRHVYSKHIHRFNMIESH